MEITFYVALTLFLLALALVAGDILLYRLKVTDDYITPEKLSMGIVLLGYTALVVTLTSGGSILL